MEQQDFITANPIIIKALGEVMDKKTANIPIVKHTFSRAFERRMRKQTNARSKLNFWYYYISLKIRIWTRLRYLRLLDCLERFRKMDGGNIE
ncbi:MAG: hypothetical protein FWC27_09895 [Firmicutes bacterium]|nr:hypothetical protein [Bacillota bacterium]